jgi:DNA-binding response OmpR family regulator
MTLVTVLNESGRRALHPRARTQTRTERDIGMPDGDGWSLISFIRRSRDHARMPIVVMTALLDSAEVLNRAYELECEYLGKPFAPEALIAKVESARRVVGAAAAVGAG